MRNDGIYTLEQIYKKHLKEIKIDDKNVVKFTRREIDIIACILSGWQYKTIAEFLNISTRTVETHKHNILKKLNKNSRGDIIGFIQKYGKLSLVQQYYRELLNQDAFKKGLKKVSALIGKNPVECLIVYRDEDYLLAQQLEKDLNLAGIKTLLKIKKTQKPITIHLENVSDIVYVGAEAFISSLSSDTKVRAIVLLLNKDKQPESDNDPHPPNIDYINFVEEPNYYSLGIKILQKLLPTAPVKESFSLFYENPKGEDTLSNKVYSKINSDDNKLPIIQKIFKLRLFLLDHKKILAFMGIIVTIISLSVWALSSKENNTSESIQSDLRIPIESVFLRRPVLVKKIEESLKENNNIKTIALVGVVGMGGAGKTTLAREFAKSHKASVVWEINAETAESLFASFKNLAYALAVTPDQRYELEFIEKIQNPDEKKTQLLFFVKKHLKIKPNWLLIYDNVVSFTEMRNYFPEDPNVWGKGKVIITTRDSNIKNTNYIKSENIIQIEELTKEESITLFSKVYYGLDPYKLSQNQKAETLKFLEQIPPFPLDVSVSAYYIKNAQITYGQYLERIEQYSKGFESAAQNLLAEVSDYTKTRYGIITSSLEKLINKNPDFKDLLFLISLLDSQNIPKGLLESYKGPIISDKFFHALLQHSLITNETNNKDKSTFSLHRSTQELGLVFLLNLLAIKEPKELDILVEKSIDSIKNYHQIHGWRTSLIPHLKSIKRKLKKMNISEKLKEKKKIDVYKMLGDINQFDGSFLLTIKYIKKIFDSSIHKSYFSKSCMARLLRTMAYAYIRTGEFDKVFFYAQESLTLCKQISNSEALSAENLGLMASAYLIKGNFEKSIYYHKLALDAISKCAVSRQSKWVKACIYEGLAYSYVTKYISREEARVSEKYAFDTLKALDGEKLFFNTTPKEKISDAIPRFKISLGEVYSIMGRYEEAMNKGFREAQYIIDNKLTAIDSRSQFPCARLFSGIGEVFLRQGLFKEAEIKLTAALELFRGIVGEHYALKPIVFRIEAYIRLNNLEKAYEDFLFVSNLKKRQDNYSTLLYLTTFYHAAIIKYKQNDLQKSVEYFGDFFKKMKEFCKGFLEEKEYKDLEFKNIFADIDLIKTPSKNDIKQYLNRSTQIFSAIYSPDHPFVRDYVMKN